MTNDKLTQTDESGNDALSDVSIADLRKYAKMMGISAQRDWGAADYVAAIKAQTEAAKFTRAEGADQSTIPPGHARLTIFRDSAPDSKNSSIPLGLNGRLFTAPRGIEIVMPLEYVAVLADAKSTYVKQKTEASATSPMGEIVEETIQSYPFQVHEVRPHDKDSKFRSQLDQRGANYLRRLACREVIGKWPTTGELLEWERELRQQKAVDAHLAMKN